MARVKICGITNAEDAASCSEAGADALGFVFWEQSPRYIEPVEAAGIVWALPPFITSVGVFVDEDEARMNEIVALTGVGSIQLHGSESPALCERLKRTHPNVSVVKVLRVKQADDIERLGLYKVSAFLLDTYNEDLPGGTGRVFDWDLAVRAKIYGPIIVAGGLGPDNVNEVIEKVKPYGVDVSSGVETEPGRKDMEKVRAFIERAKGR